MFGDLKPVDGLADFPFSPSAQAPLGRGVLVPRDSMRETCCRRSSDVRLAASWVGSLGEVSCRLGDDGDYGVAVVLGDHGFGFRVLVVDGERECEWVGADCFVLFWGELDRLDARSIATLADEPHRFAVSLGRSDLLVSLAKDRLVMRLGHAPVTHDEPRTVG